MATNNYDELTRKCQEIFDKLILENKDEIEQLNKNEEKNHKTKPMAPPNSYGLYGSSRKQCDIECTIVRPRSHSVPASFLSEYNAKQVNDINMDNTLFKNKPSTFEPIQEEGEFKFAQRPKYNYTISTDPVLNAELRKISNDINGSYPKSLSSISETEILNIESLINKNEGKEPKENAKITNIGRSYSYSYGNTYIKSPLSIDEYKKRVELEVYRQQIKCHEKLEFENIKRNKYQKFLKWQEVDYQNKKNSWNI